jgi:fibronectin type 3 domain-containing protein
VEVEAMASGVGQKPFIDLAWRADADADLAGYNVYRREADGQWSKRNAAPVPVPAFRDEEVTPGMTYTYVVTAVDVRGNESRRSEAASETLPQP